MTNRWLLKTPYGEIKIYADTSEKAKQIFPEATEIMPYTDMSYLEYIDKTKNKSKFYAYDHKGREVYTFEMPDGTLIIKFSKEDGDYFDIAFYQLWRDKRHIDPVGFIMSNPKSVYEEFMGDPMSYERISYRQYGQPKLSKPKELKGIKQSFSGEYIPKKCNCPCFCVGDDLYIQHKDFFSRSFKPPDEDFDKPLSYLLNKYFNKNKSEKFCYPDCWGEIILRDETWIVFKNIKPIAERNNLSQLARIIIDTMIENDTIAKRNLTGHSEFVSQWERFFEDISKKYKEWLKVNYKS